MPTLPPSPDRPPGTQRALLRNFERAAGELNPFLAILAIGIAILDLTCYMGVVGSRQLALHQSGYAASPAATSAGPIGTKPVAYGQ
jgi:hypothetical protein